MNLIQVVIMSIVEGISEFLPISSTAHLTLTANLLHIPQTEFVKSFEIIVQLGAIAAVGQRFIKTIIKDKQMIFKILSGFIPTMVIGLVLYKVIKTFFLGNIYITLFGLAFGGLALIIFDRQSSSKLTVDNNSPKLNLSYRQSILIGIAQSLAMIPGVSRSAATILTGLKLNLSRTDAVEYSFLLSVPVMIAASGLDVIKTGFSFTSVEWQLIAVGLVTSFLTAAASLNWLVSFVKNHSLAWFGWYRLIIVFVMIVLTQ